MARLYIGNLPFTAEEADVQQWFQQLGFEVGDIMIARDRNSGQPRGFGFVETLGQVDVQDAITQCNGQQFLGRTVIVNEARPRVSAYRGEFRTRRSA